MLQPKWAKWEDILVKKKKAPNLKVGRIGGTCEKLSIPDSYQVMYVCFLSVSHVLKEKTLVLFPAPWGQAAPSQSNMPGTSGFGVYGVETTTGTIYRDLLLWDLGPKNPQSNTHGLQQN